MKQKHAKGPDGQPLPAPTSGRGRGRPKKNVSKVDPTSEEYFRGERGGNSNILEGFDDAVQLLQEANPKYKDSKDYPMYKFMAPYTTPQENKEDEETKGGLLPETEKIPEEDKGAMTCD